ncbi:MAG: carboxypeptidase regulatory-like domain-containing protein [Deltaproteobacteria bacterium]|nr:carboxypeptidase regulatory-like domain-containing protein [Deltaproteobacteria bacterium]
MGLVIATRFVEGCRHGAHPESSMQRIALFAFLSLAACGSKNPVGDDEADAGFIPDACVGLECQVVDCAIAQKPPTTFTGRVFAPNGTLPLYGINVYVPRSDPGPFTEGAICDKCSSSLPGNPLVQTVTDENGNFRLENVPAGDNVPLIVTTGKWRRKLTIAKVASCQDTALPEADTRLPKTKAEGDIPKIAITTGDADSLECLVRKLGIDDSEISNGTGAGRIHLYRGDGVQNFKAGFPGGGGAISSAIPFWSTVDNLKAYDIVFLSCEGSHRPADKPQVALDAMKAYADLGGRVFASHWHNIWIGGNFQNQGANPTLAPPVWKDLARWRPDDSVLPTSPIVIDEVSNPKGDSFATWMLNVGGSTVRDEITVVNGRATTVTLDTTRAERWVATRANDPRSPNTAQIFQFTTPNEDIVDNRCGKVVFSDMHVTGTSNINNPYPQSCPGGENALDMSPQEKALAFMFFDIASCVGGVF